MSYHENEPTRIPQEQRIASWPTPEIAKDVQRFLRLSGYYGRFVKGYATIAKPLHRITEQPNKFQWTQQCQEGFEELRYRLTSPPITGPPGLRSPIYPGYRCKRRWNRSSPFTN